MELVFKKNPLVSEAEVQRFSIFGEGSFFLMKPLGSVTPSGLVILDS
jgi:hypothetical protein